MPPATRVLAGDCTVRFEDDDVREERGSVVVLTKPDGTVLVHDSDGYRPVAWMTRAGSVTWHDAGGRLEAVDDGRRLSVTCHTAYGDGTYLTSRAGTPVGDCPDCGGVLVHERSAITCLACQDRHVVPGDATVTDATCDSCGLPTIAVERGATFEVCADRSCESIDDRVRERFDGEWACRECGDDLLVLRRGGLLLGCSSYPDCETGYAFPTGVLEEECECGLPRFDVGAETHCLDRTCTIGRPTSHRTGTQVICPPTGTNGHGRPSTRGRGDRRRGRPPAISRRAGIRPPALRKRDRTCARRSGAPALSGRPGHG